MFDRKKYNKEWYKQWSKRNPEKVKEKNRQWRKSNPEYIKEYYIKNKGKLVKRRRLYSIKNSEKEKERKKQWYIDNKKRILKHNKEYRNREETKEKIKKYKKIYYQNNKGHINKHKKYRYETNLKFYLNCQIAGAIRKTIKNNKNGRHWEDLVGYTLKDLTKYLKKTMPEGYTWQDYLEGKLHIDHKIPISAHNFTKPEHPDFKRCWALSNLRLLPARENLIKGKRLSRLFQSALQLS